MLSTSRGWVEAGPKAELSCPCPAQISGKEVEMNLFKWHLDPLPQGLLLQQGVNRVAESREQLCSNSY